MVKILVNGYLGCNVVFFDKNLKIKRILDATPSFPEAHSIVNNLERILFFGNKILLLDNFKDLWEIRKTDLGILLMKLWESVYDVRIKKDAYILAEDLFFVYKDEEFKEIPCIKRYIVSNALSFDIKEGFYFLTDDGNIYRNNKKIVSLSKFFGSDVIYHLIRVVSHNNFVVSVEDDVGISVVNVFKKNDKWKLYNVVNHVADEYFGVYRNFVIVPTHKRKKEGNKYKEWIVLQIFDVYSKKVISRVYVPCAQDYLYVSQVLHWIPSWFYEMIKNRELPPITKVQTQGR